MAGFPKTTQRRKEHRVSQWNLKHPVGTHVAYWRLVKEGAPSGQGKTTSEAWMMGGHTPVVLIDGCSGAIALTHVEVADSQQATNAEGSR